MDTLSDLVTRFYSKDPILGEEASYELLKNWRAEAIEALVPLDADVYRYSYQVELRLRFVASVLGPEIVPHLVQAITIGPWSSKRAAAVCFSGIANSEETEQPLIEILKTQPHFDAERMAIESLGRLGARHLAYDLERYARRGKWNDPSDRLQDYPFEKLSSFVLEAFTRFTALESDPDSADTMFGDLTALIELRESRLGRNRIPTSYDVVEDLSNEFVEWGVDPIIKHWGRSSNENLQRLAVDLLRNVTPLTATEFLLETAIDPSKSDSVRRGASIALGELRVPEVAQRLTVALKDPAVDRTHLDWAFSTLYAVPADWSGLSGYVDELLKHNNDQSLQLRYSLALKGDDRCLKDLIRCLDDPDLFVRWTSALALARLLGPKARPYLEQRAQNVEHNGERCAMYAAMIRAGDHEKVGHLHEALQEVDLSSLFSVWKLEIVDAFRSVPTFGERAFSLWRDATQIGTRQLQYFEALVPLPGTTKSNFAYRTKVFVSYSHEDARWLNRLQVHLKPLERSKKVTLWSDELIEPGQDWHDVIRRALEETKVAVLLISADFLASDFIHSVELPALLEVAQSEGVLILSIHVSASMFEMIEGLAEIQSVNSPELPLNALQESEQEAILVKASRIVEKTFRS